MQYANLLIFALVMGFVMLRRARGLIARQMVKPAGMMMRLAVYSLIGLLLLAVSIIHPWSLIGDLLGLAAGLALAWYGLRLTTFEETPAGLHYTPNKYIGLGVFALFLVRIVSRLAPILLAGNDLSALSAAPAGANPYLSFASDPITTGALFVIIGYYALYYGAILLRHRQTVAAR